jgi:hypothetical protein
MSAFFTVSNMPHVPYAALAGWAGSDPPYPPGQARRLSHHWEFRGHNTPFAVFLIGNTRTEYAFRFLSENVYEKVARASCPCVPWASGPWGRAETALRRMGGTPMPRYFQSSSERIIALARPGGRVVESGSRTVNNSSP